MADSLEPEVLHPVSKFTLVDSTCNSMNIRLRPISLLLLFSLATSFNSAAQSIKLPDIGDPSRQYLSSENERRLGLATMQQIRQQGVVIEDVQLNEYLSSIGQSLGAFAQNNGNPFTFFLVTDPSINAFAAPSGFIGVHSGLVLATQSEDELAGVLAHEIAHVSQGHIARAFADAQTMNIPLAAALVASALIAAASDRAGSAAIASTLAAGTQHRINFTRALEQEADRLGTRILTQAGFNPNGLATFFGRLERYSGGAAAQIPEFLRDHPLPSSRIADTQNRINNPINRKKPRDDISYQLAKARLQVLSNGDTSALLQQFETSLAKRGYTDETAERYGYALALKRAGRYAEALRQITRLRTVKPDNLAFRIEEAEITLAKGDRAGAWRLFEDTKKLFTDDFTLDMYYGQALAVQGDPRQAMQLLQPYLGRRPSDAPLYALYAQAAQRAGEMATTHATLAEYYYLTGDLKRATEQAELGIKNAGATSYQQAQLRARLKQFKEEASVQ
jgi:predicted Zn-dependent protease